MNETKKKEFEEFLKKSDIFCTKASGDIIWSFIESSLKEARVDENSQWLETDLGAGSRADTRAKLYNRNKQLEKE